MNKEQALKVIQSFPDNYDIDVVIKGILKHKKVDKPDVEMATPAQIKKIFALVTEHGYKRPAKILDNMTKSQARVGIDNTMKDMNSNNDTVVELVKPKSNDELDYMNKLLREHTFHARQIGGFGSMEIGGHRDEFTCTCGKVCDGMSGAERHIKDMMADKFGMDNLEAHSLLQDAGGIEWDGINPDPFNQEIERREHG